MDIVHLQGRDMVYTLKGYASRNHIGNSQGFQLLTNQLKNFQHNSGILANLSRKAGEIGLQTITSRDAIDLSGMKSPQAWQQQEGQMLHGMEVCEVEGCMG